MTGDAGLGSGSVADSLQRRLTAETGVWDASLGPLSAAGLRSICTGRAGEL